MLAKHLLGLTLNLQLSAVYNLYTFHDIDLLISVQNRAAHWIESFGIHLLVSGENLQLFVLKNLNNMALIQSVSFLHFHFILYSILRETTSIDFLHQFQFSTLAIRLHHPSVKLMSSTIKSLNIVFLLLYPVIYILLWIFVLHEILSQPALQAFKNKLK